jgi:hypothetical protein
LIVKVGCRKLILEIGKYKFPTHLVVLESQGLDVILGMDWMTNYAGVIDCVNRAITLTTPEGRRIRYKSNMDFNSIRLNHLKGAIIEDVAVVREYPNVFLDELLMTHKYRGSQQSSREVLPKFIDSTQGEPKNICKP